MVIATMRLSVKFAARLIRTFTEQALQLQDHEPLEADLATGIHVIPIRPEMSVAHHAVRDLSHAVTAQRRLEGMGQGMH